MSNANFSVYRDENNKGNLYVTIEEMLDIEALAMDDELFWRGAIDYINSEHFKSPEKSLLSIVMDYIMKTKNAVEEED